MAFHRLHSFTKKNLDVGDISFNSEKKNLQKFKTPAKIKARSELRKHVRFNAVLPALILTKDTFTQGEKEPTITTGAITNIGICGCGFLANQAIEVDMNAYLIFNLSTGEPPLKIKGHIKSRCEFIYKDQILHSFAFKELADDEIDDAVTDLFDQNTKTGMPLNFIGSSDKSQKDEYPLSKLARFIRLFYSPHTSAHEMEELSKFDLLQTNHVLSNEVILQTLEKSRLKRLRKITHLISSAEDMDETMINLKDSIATLFDAERITIYEVDKIKQELFLRVKVGDIPHQNPLTVNRESVAGYVAGTDVGISINDAYSKNELMAIDKNLKFDRSWDKMTGFRTRQILSQSLRHKKHLLGVIQLINKKSGNAFTAQDSSSLQEIAEVLGLAFYNSKKHSIRYESKFDYLVQQNIITMSELKQGIDEARERKRDLADVLMKTFKIDKELIGKSLSAYYKVEFLEHNGSHTPPLELLDRFAMKNPLKFMRHNCWVPYSEIDGKVFVVCEDPSDYSKIADMKLLLRKNEFEIVVGIRSDIIQIIGKLSGKTAPKMDKDFKNIEVDCSGAIDEELKEEGTSVNENDTGIVKLVNQMIMEAYFKGVSDIHVETYPGKQNAIVRFRKDGVCYIYNEIPPSWKRAVIARIKIISNLDIAERRLPQDGKILFKFGNKSIELRVATLPTYSGNEDAVMRILAASEPMPLDKLNLSSKNLKHLTEAIKKTHGIFLVVGPTGSGKTTTLHSALRHINTPERKIWTAEDPIEITQHGLRQVQMQPKINLTFATALRSFLRADPDVIMIGEMRDEETASMGIEASLTGHLVFSTLHTNSAPETVTRLIDLGIDTFNFADALLGILAQRLVRTLCKKCKAQYKPSGKELDLLAREYNEKLWPELNATVDSVKMFKPVGCEKCNKSGFSGRTGVHEIFVMDSDTKRLIQNKAAIDDIRDSASRNGMRTLKQDGIWKVTKGDTTIEMVRSVCS